MNQQDEVMEIDLLAMAKYLLKNWVIIFVVAVLSAAIGWGYVNCISSDEYVSNVTVYIQDFECTENEIKYEDDIDEDEQLVHTYINALTCETILDEVSNELQDEFSTATLKSCMSAEQLDDTTMFSISITTSDAASCEKIAKAVAKVAAMEIPELLGGPEASTIEVSNAGKVGHTKRVAIITVLGCFLIVGVLCVIFIFDGKIRDIEELKKMTGVPLLGIISRKDTKSRATYDRIAMNLRYALGEDAKNKAVCLSATESVDENGIITNLIESLENSDNHVMMIPSDVHGEILAKKMQEKTQYDYVLVDTSADNLIKDALLFSQYADGLVLIIRLGKNKRKDIKDIIEETKFRKLTTIGVIAIKE